MYTFLEESTEDQNSTMPLPCISLEMEQVTIPMYIRTADGGTADDSELFCENKGGVSSVSWY